MNRQKKEQEIKSLKENFVSSEASFVVGYKGLTVEDLMGLRSQLREQGGTLKVSKVNLMKLALDDVDGAQELVPALDGQIAFVFAKQEAPAVAKTIYTYSEDKEALDVKGGFFEQRFLSVQDVKTLATLPPREVLLAQLCGVLQAPVAGLARTLHMVPTQLACVLKKVEEKKAAGN